MSYHAGAIGQLASETCRSLTLVPHQPYTTRCSSVHQDELKVPYGNSGSVLQHQHSTEAGRIHQRAERFPPPPSPHHPTPQESPTGPLQPLQPTPAALSSPPQLRGFTLRFHVEQYQTIISFFFFHNGFFFFLPFLSEHSVFSDLHLPALIICSADQFPCLEVQQHM